MTVRRWVALLWTLQVACVVTFTSVTSVAAQTSGASDPERGAFSGYVFGAPGLWYNSYCKEPDVRTGWCAHPSLTSPETLPHVGGGVEWQPHRSLGVSAEAGVILSNGYVGGLLSANGSYHFRGARAAARSLVPFVTGGYSRDPDGANGFNLGGGVTYWKRGGTGVRLDVRAHHWTYVRFLEFRVGLAF